MEPAKQCTELDPNYPERKLDQDKLWPDFTVRCDKCGSHAVTLENTMGFSEESGSWGGIDFKCLSCGNQTEIVGA